MIDLWEQEGFTGMACCTSTEGVLGADGLLNLKKRTVTTLPLSNQDGPGWNDMETTHLPSLSPASGAPALQERVREG